MCNPLNNGNGDGIGTGDYDIKREDHNWSPCEDLKKAKELCANLEALR